MVFGYMTTQQADSAIEYSDRIGHFGAQRPTQRGGTNAPAKPTRIRIKKRRIFGCGDAAMGLREFSGCVISIMRGKSIVAGMMLLALVSNKGVALAGETKPLYQNNFEKAEVGKVPEEFLVLDGEFTVKEENGNKFLELPGAPLDSFGLLFGPTEKSDFAVSARINGTKKGRRYPTFGVGLNGQGGFRMLVSPGKGALELYEGDNVVASVPYEWKSGQWTMLWLRISKPGDAWKIEGKAWEQGATEPAQPMISFEAKKEPSAGRASIWGNPYATTPIQYDDLLVTRTGPGK